MSAVGTPSRGARFPDLVWDVPVLRGLDARSRREIEAAGRLRELRKGAHVHRVGDPADALYVVIAGTCSIVAVRRGETSESVLRRVTAGEMFGEEAIVTTFASRAFEAHAESAATIAEIPIAVLRRAVGRGADSDGEVVARIERALRRAATLDLLRTTAFGRGLAPRDLEILIDAARHLHVARGEHVYREGDPAEDAFFVADGILSAQSNDDGKPRVEAYLTRGDLFGDEDAEEDEGRALAVVAAGPAWLVAVPRAVFAQVARRSGALAEGARRLRAERGPRPLPGVQTTAHVFKDVYRMRIARSLLVIDQDACIRCGHCAWSCASVHDDGISRLVRRGDKIVVMAQEEGPREAAPLLVPNSCQHCKNPACMIDCPTGAIGRDARGEVFIREDLCTGCGACAKACPWDNIQIAKRKGEGARFPDVAVKCDLCAGSATGPACVSSCPTQAIARVDPSAAFAELRAMAPMTILGRPPASDAGGLLPQRTPGWPVIAGASAAALGIALVPIGAWASGIAAGALFVLLVAYSATKRAPRLLARLRRPRLARPLYIAHATLGALLAGVTVSHTGLRVPDTAAGALLLALLVTIATGAFGAVVNVLVPPRLARLERRSVLPEELAARARELDARIFERLSGRSELVKTLFGRVLRPYRRARLGACVLAVSGVALREEETRVRRRVDALLEGRKSERLVGMEELIKLAVERRAISAQAILTRLLRGWIALHLAATGAAIVLLIIHVLSLRGRP